MIIIGICDDEQLHRIRVKELCERYFSEYPNEHDYVEFSSGEEVLAYEGERMYLLFLDIEMGETNGIEVLNALREKDNVWRIAFASSHTEYAIDTIDMKTLAFLNKPLTYEGVKKCLDIAIRENEENISATFTLMDGKRDVVLSDIIYIQAERHYVNVYARKDDFMGYDSLKQYEEQLQGTSMIRIHKSYLVNMQYVKKVLAEEIVMTDGKRLPIGRKYSNDVKEKYFSFVKSVTIGRNEKKYL